MIRKKWLGVFILSLVGLIGGNGISVYADSVAESTNTVMGQTVVKTYDSLDIKNIEYVENEVIYFFTDDTSISVDMKDLKIIDLEKGEFYVEENYSILSMRAGGAINFPATIKAGYSSSGTSNYPPQTVTVTRTYNKAYRESVYVATYKGSIPLTSVQGSSGGGKTYQYNGSIPYVSHKKK